MASLALRLRSSSSAAAKPLSLLRPFSSSSPNPNPNPDPTAPDSTPKPVSSSVFTDIKSRLQHSNQQHRLHPPPPPSPPPPSPPRSFAPQQQQTSPPTDPLDDIRSRLSGFRSPPDSSRSFSFRDLDRNNGNERPRMTSSLESIEAIRNSLRGLNVAKKENSSSSSSSRIESRESADRKVLSLDNFTKVLRMTPPEAGDNAANDVMKKSVLPSSIFGKEREREVMGEKEEAKARMEFYKPYDYQELGEKMRKLKEKEGEGKKKGDREGGFSLSELGGRLASLRKMEEEEAEKRVRDGGFGFLRHNIMRLGETQLDNNRRYPDVPINIMSSLGAPSYRLSPPKEHLVEKYFHPDNMSSAEKMKIELKKVRDEFKMSDTDCGSTRVQIAQLTTEISHLSAVLHKKDKHSRKGLIAKVQRRKTLLKYLRRTDWDSYRLVLSRFGLRDNPDYKQLAR